MHLLPLWGTEKEKLDDFYERASVQDYMQTILERVESPRFTTGLEDDIAKFCESFPKIINDLENLLTDSRIFKRNVDIGLVTKEDALDCSFTGVMIRGSGIPWDLENHSHMIAMINWNLRYRKKWGVMIAIYVELKKRKKCINNKTMFI